MTNVEKAVWLEKVKIQNHQMMNSKKSLMSYSVNTCLHEVPDELKDDIDINFTAAIIGKEHLWNVSDNLRGDKNFILKLIDANYERNIYDYLLKDLKEDKDIFLKCMERQDSIKNTSISGFPKNILENKELILKAMKLNNIFKALKNHYDLDKDVMEIHLERNPREFFYVKKSVKNYFNTIKRKSIILKFMHSAAKQYASEDIYNHLNEELMNDLDIIDVLLNDSPKNIEYIPKELKLNRNFMLNVIKQYNVIKIDDSFKNDREIVEIIVGKNGKNLKIFSDWMNDVELVKLAIKTYPQLDILNNLMLNNKELVYQIVQKEPKQCEWLFSKLKKYRDDEDIMRIAVNYDAKLFEYAENINDKEIIALVVDKTKNFDYVDSNILKNQKLVLELLKITDNVRKAINNNNFMQIYKNDIDVVKEIIIKSPDHIVNFMSLKANKDFVLFAISCGLTNIQKIDTDLYHDKDIVKMFLEKDHNNYYHLPWSFKNDEDIALQSLKNISYYKAIIRNSDLENNVSFHMKAIRKNSKLYEEINIDSDIKYNRDIIINYIDSCMAQNVSVVLPQKIFDKYNTTNPAAIKSNMLLEDIEDELDTPQGILKKKIKI